MTVLSFNAEDMGGRRSSRVLFVRMAMRGSWLLTLLSCPDIAEVW